MSKETTFVAQEVKPEPVPAVEVQAVDNPAADLVRSFVNQDFGTVRVVVKDDRLWFVGKDVAEALGYRKGKSLANAVANHVDKEDKGVTEMMTPGGRQNMVLINESGLYSLILSSKLPTAKAFKRWITEEVIPSVRKNGAYMTPNTLEKAISDPDFLIQLLTELKNTREQNRIISRENEIITRKNEVITRENEDMRIVNQALVHETSTWDRRKVLCALVRAQKHL